VLVNCLMKAGLAVALGATSFRRVASGAIAAMAIAIGVALVML
jgi:hypothetical protein